MSKVDTIGLHAEKLPNKLAIVQDDRKLTWSEYVGMRNRYADGMSTLGLRAAERVVIFGHNSIEWLLTQHMCASLGSVFVPCNWRLSQDEVKWVFQNSEAACVVFDEEFGPTVDVLAPHCPLVRYWVAMQPTARKYARTVGSIIASGKPVQPALPNAATMLYTGGTSGKPKAAVRTKPNPTAGIWLKAVDMHLYGHIHLSATPLYHSAPNAMCALACMLGGTVVMMPKFEARRALQLIQEYKIQSTYMPPVLLKRMLAVPPEVFKQYDVSSLKCITVGGAPCPMSTKIAINKMFGPVYYEFYGSTELGINSVLRPEDVERKYGSCGKVLPGVEVGIFNDKFERLGANQEGELYVKRYQGMFEGYYGDEEKTKKSFKGDWSSVGDIAYLDEDNFLFIMDRKIDMIISGGVNIYPAEIEDCLHKHPAVSDVAVFGTPDDEYGERVHAAVQLKPGAAVTAAELIQFAQNNIARFKAPKEISFHTELPRTEHGKILKRTLRDQHWAGRKARL